jgi:hypothetical protein
VLIPVVYQSFGGVVKSLFAAIAAGEDMRCKSVSPALAQRDTAPRYSSCRRSRPRILSERIPRLELLYQYGCARRPLGLAVVLWAGGGACQPPLLFFPTESTDLIFGPRFGFTSAKADGLEGAASGPASINFPLLNVNFVIGPARSAASDFAEHDFSLRS